MEKLDMQTPNIADKNYEALSKMFPNAVTETIDENGEVVRAIDADVLRQEISCKVVEGKEERYQFTWPDKKKAVINANSVVNSTLRPDRVESVGFEETKNLYIEGDNLEVLKLLQETYLEKIDLIYIDPPYNTGSDLIYYDDFSESNKDYAEKSGLFDEDGNRLDINSSSNGRFHTDWLNMMYPRMKLSRNLMSDRGLLFVSIGDEEQATLRNMLNEIFGEQNYIGQVARVAKTTSFKGNYFAPSKDYLLVYAKNITCIDHFVDDIDDSQFKKVETDGPRKGERYRDDIAFYLSTLDITRGSYSQRYWIECPDGSKVIPPGKTFPPDKGIAGDGVWRWTPDTYEAKKEYIVFKETKTSPLLDENGNKAKWNLYTKSYLSEKKDSGNVPRDFWTDFLNRNGSERLKKLKIPFDYAKPDEMIRYIFKICNLGKDAIVMDFFSGSATTADAVLEYNEEDDGNRSFIMVQIPEECSEKSKAVVEGYKTICDIGKERIRRVGNSLKEKGSSKDVGFRVLKVDSSNMKDIYYRPIDTDQMRLDMFTDNIKEDRTPEDLLFQVMLDLGVLLSSRIEETEIAGKKVFNVADGFLIACFDKDVTDETIKAVANMKPYYAVFRDSSMANDSVATNFDQIFANISPDTIRKVL